MMKMATPMAVVEMIWKPLLRLQKEQCKINKENHVTIILTTHDMQDIASLAKRIILIGKGQILYDGSLKKLNSIYGNYKKVKIYTNELIDIKSKGIISREKQTDGYKFVVDSNIITVSEFINNITKKYKIEDIDIDNPSIDDVIIRLYEDYKL